MRILPISLLALAFAAPAQAAPVADLQAAEPLLFLANLDDDSGRCEGPLQALMRSGFKVDEPAACHDAADTVVNGPGDVADLTPLRIAAWPDAPEGATASIVVTGKARVLRDGAAFGGTLGAADLRAGVDLGIEGLDVVRDLAVWDGRATFTLTVTADGETAVDSLTGRVAPILFPSAVEPPQTLYARRGPTAAEVAARIDEAKTTWARIRREMRADPDAILRSLPELERYRDDPAGLKRLAERQVEDAGASERRWQRFARSYKATLRRYAPTREFDGGVFAQDAFETGVAATQAQTMRVSVLAPTFGDQKLTGRLIAFGAWPYQHLRGPGKAVVTGGEYDATGNFEPTPPTPGAPTGRLLIGTTADDDEWTAFLGAQGQQPVVRVDTSGLAVGHVDELVAVIPTTSGKGWVLAVADPGAALKLTRPKAAVVKRSKTMAKRLDALATRLATELEADIVRIPVLFGPGDGGIYAATGNTLNGFAASGHAFLAPDPHDAALKRATREALEGLGVKLRFIDTLPFPHERLGEVHCYTNVIREPGALSTWWKANSA